MKKIKVKLLPLRCLLFVFSFLCLAMITGNSADELIHWWSIICSICNIITILLLLWICKKENITYKQLLNWEKGNTKVISIVIGIIATLVIGMGGMYIAGFFVYGKFPYMATFMIAPIPLWLAIINIFILPITTTMAEDGLYLGYAMNINKNKWVAILFPAFFYALQHSFIPILFDWKYIVYRLFSFLPLTIIFCYWYYKKRNPIPIMVGHFVINIVTAAQIVVTSASPELFKIMQQM